MKPTYFLLLLFLQLLSPNRLRRTFHSFTRVSAYRKQIRSLKGRALSFSPSVENKRAKAYKAASVKNLTQTGTEKKFSWSQLDANYSSCLVINEAWCTAPVCQNKTDETLVTAVLDFLKLHNNIHKCALAESLRRNQCSW